MSKTDTAVVHQLWFVHKNGAKKQIPGVLDTAQLAPRIYQDTQTMADGRTRYVMKTDMDHIVKLNLLNEDVEVKLTPREEAFPDGVKERILADRSKDVYAMIQANESLRNTLRYYEANNEVEVLEWDKVVDLKSQEAREGIITELSEIAMADMEARGIEIPAKFKKVKTAVQDTPNIEVKAGPKKKPE
jgi:hypothetical protein